MKIDSKRMTMRDRILAVIQGKQVDTVPFVLYEGIFPTPQLVEVLGRGNFGLMRWSQVHKVKHPNCRFVTDDFYINDHRCQRITLFTPTGAIFEERIFEPVLNSSSIRKHFLQEKKDYEVLWYYLSDSMILPDYERYHCDQADLGDTGVPLVAIERTPYQQLWIIWAGLDNFSYHWADFPDYVEKTIQLLTERERKLMDVAYYSPAPFIDFPDNITADAIGPKRFKQYCVPLYDELAGMLAERDAYAFSHMDGNLKPLWQEIANSRLGGLDSFSPAPDNDTTVAEAVALWPEKRLFINFPSSIHLQPADQIYEEAIHILDTAGHTGRLQIQISENVPPFVWRTSLPQIIKAIQDFGQP